MLCILDLFPHNSVPEHLRSEASLQSTFTLFVNLPLRYAFQYGLNTLKQEELSTNTSTCDGSISASPLPIPGVWVFARSKEALRDIFRDDACFQQYKGQHKEHNHRNYQRHPWDHFERESSAFRADQWARMTIHYCPTVQHLESFFRCIHLNHMIMQQQQQRQQECGHQQEKSNTPPLLILLVGFFDLDAVNKDISASSSSSTTAYQYPYPNSANGGAAATILTGDQHRPHLKLVSQVMSEIKDATQWIEKTLNRPVQVHISEQIGQQEQQNQPHPVASRYATQSQPPASPATTILHNQSLWLQTALGFWTDAIVTISIISPSSVPQGGGDREVKIDDTNSRNMEEAGGDRHMVCFSRLYQLCVRTKQSQRQWFLTTSTSSATEMPLPSEQDGVGSSALSSLPRQQGANLSPSDYSQCSCREPSHRATMGRRAASSLGSSALVLEWGYCPHDSLVIKTLVQQGGS